MINRRLVLGMIAAATAIDASRIALAKEKHHLNGKDLLGERIKQNGKHKIHTTANKVDVFAEVNNGKVTAVTAAGMQVKKVKSRQKLAETTPGITLASMQLAQADVYYYGYWVYDRPGKRSLGESCQNEKRLPSTAATTRSRLEPSGA